MIALGRVSWFKLDKKFGFVELEGGVAQITRAAPAIRCARGRHPSGLAAKAIGRDGGPRISLFLLVPDFHNKGLSRACGQNTLTSKHGTRGMATAKEFVEFWLENSVHPDEQFGARRGREAIQNLADNLVRAAEAQGFTKAQVEAEIGDIYDHIRASIDRQNKVEDSRLGKEKR
jgi:hypothetical protein